MAPGADVKLVQAVAGHASPLITLRRYSHLLDSRLSDAADRFDTAGLGDARLGLSPAALDCYPAARRLAGSADGRTLSSS